MTEGSGMRIDLGAILDEVRARLQEKGIDIDIRGDAGACCGGEDSPRVKVVCVAPGLGNSVREMGETQRDQVVMVRVDEATSKALDAWVETGAVKSRSEAAALFIREGLKVRADELEHLRDALHDVEEARAKLRRRAKDVIGDMGERSGES